MLNILNNLPGPSRRVAAAAVLVPHPALNGVAAQPHFFLECIYRGQEKTEKRGESGREQNTRGKRKAAFPRARHLGTRKGFV